MILFKEDDNAYVALSTYEFTFVGQAPFGIIPENAPVFKTEYDPAAFIAVGGNNCNAIADAIRYGCISVRKNITEKSIRDDVIVYIKIHLTHGGIYPENGLEDNTFVFGKDGRLFASIGEHYVFEICDYYSVSNTKRFDCTLLENTKHLRGEERIREVYRIKEKYSATSQFPVVYMDTKTYELHIIDKED